MRWRAHRPADQRGTRIGLVGKQNSFFCGFILLIGPVKHLGQPPIQNDHFAEVAQHHVAGFQITVQDAGRMCVWFTYAAIEPYARRLWPNLLVSWSRIIVGRWRDLSSGVTSSTVDWLHCSSN